jgi:16S rRNA (guanine527-N7)-methyltransferase
MESLELLFPRISSIQREQLERYAELLLEYNERFNLLSRSDQINLWPHHMFPSLIAEAVVPLHPAAAVIDVGSGGGFPGLPWKIIRPDLQVVLVDSIRKKVLFLKKVIQDLKLTNIIALQIRISPENDLLQLGGRFDVVTARAIASISTLLRMCKHLLNSQGFILAWKGESDVSELQDKWLSNQLQSEIYHIPEKFHHLSPKFAHMRLIKLKPFQGKFTELVW